MPNMLKSPCLIAMGVLLSGCTLGFNATFEELSLVRQEPNGIVEQYSLPGRKGPKLPLTGDLRLDFATDKDLLALMQDDGYNLWYKAETCQSGVEIAKWPYVYQNRGDSHDGSGSIHKYSVFLEPRWRGRSYDLVTAPESICVRVGAGKMVSLFVYKSNIMEIDRESVIAAFANGE